MESRWASLAVEAHIKKALDFSKITSNNKESLVLESLVLNYLFRERKITNINGQSLLAIAQTLCSDSDRSTLYLRATTLKEEIFPWLKSVFSPNRDSKERDEEIIKMMKRFEKDL